MGMRDNDRVRGEGCASALMPVSMQMEMAWRKEPVGVWPWASQYLQRRYGSGPGFLTDAWYYLVNSVYKYGFNVSAKFFIETAPGLVMPR